MNHESNPIRIIEIKGPKGHPMPSQNLYIILLELDDNEKIDIQACESGFICEKE